MKSSTNLKAVEKRLKKYLGRDVPAARVTATNKALAKAKTAVVKAVVIETGVKTKNLKSRVYISRAKGGQKPKGAKLHFYRRGVALIGLGAKQIEGGVTAGQYLVPDGFIADGSKGFGRGRLRQAHVLRRKGRGQYPLEIITVNIKPAVNRLTPITVSRVMASNFSRLYQHEIKRRASRA